MRHFTDSAKKLGNYTIVKTVFLCIVLIHLKYILNFGKDGNADVTVSASYGVTLCPFYFRDPPMVVIESTRCTQFRRIAYSITTQPSQENTPITLHSGNATKLMEEIKHSNS